MMIARLIVWSVLAAEVVLAVLTVVQLMSVDQRCAIDLALAICAVSEHAPLAAGLIAVTGALTGATLAWQSVERQMNAQERRRRDDAETQRTERLETLCSHLQLMATRAEAGAVMIPESSIEACAARLPEAGAIDRVVRQGLTGLIADVVGYNSAPEVAGNRTIIRVRSLCLRAVFRSAIKDPNLELPCLTARQVSGLRGWDTVPLGWVENLMSADEKAMLDAARAAAKKPTSGR